MRNPGCLEEDNLNSRGLGPNITPRLLALAAMLHHEDC
jgi:hypothetical protein